MYNFPVQTAEQDGSGLWSLQLFLLEECETYLGQKSGDKVVYQPIFNSHEKAGKPEDRPHIINSKRLDGAMASLSNNSRSYWPTVLYELAHETVHLLNPVTGHTNYLEEGLAVYFSIQMSQSNTNHSMSPDCPFYQKSLSLVQQFPDGVYVSGKKIREHFGSLGAASSAELLKLFPKLDKVVADELCQECNFT